MAYIDLYSRVQRVSAQMSFESKASKPTIKIPFDVFVHKDPGLRRLARELDKIATDIANLDPKDPQAQKVKEMWDRFSEMQTQDVDESNWPLTITDCSCQMMEIAKAVNKLDSCHVLIPMGSPFGFNQHYPLDLVVVNPDVPTAAFDNQFYLIDTSGDFERFISQEELSSLDRTNPHICLASGTYFVNDLGHPTVALQDNEVTIDELREMEDLFLAIERGDTSIRIDGTGDFRQMILSNLHILLTRRLGVKLLKELTDPDNLGKKPLVFIERETEPSASSELYDKVTGNYYKFTDPQIKFENNTHYLNAADGSPRRALTFCNVVLLPSKSLSLVSIEQSSQLKYKKLGQPFIIVAHELIHIYHRLTGPAPQSQLSSDVDYSKYTDDEELWTIVGRKQGGESPYNENAFRLAFGQQVRVYHITEGNTPLTNSLLLNMPTDLVNYFISGPSIYNSPENILRLALTFNCDPQIMELCLYFCFPSRSMPAFLIDHLPNATLNQLEAAKKAQTLTYNTNSALLASIVGNFGLRDSEVLQLIKFFEEEGLPIFNGDFKDQRALWTSILKGNNTQSINYLIGQGNFTQDLFLMAIEAQNVKAAKQMLSKNPALLYEPVNLVDRELQARFTRPDFDRFVQFIVVILKDYADFERVGPSGKTPRALLDMLARKDPRLQNFVRYVDIYQKTRSSTPIGASELSELELDERAFFTRITEGVFVQLEGPSLARPPSIGAEMSNDLLRLFFKGLSVHHFARYLVHFNVSPYSVFPNGKNLLEMALSKPGCNPDILKLLFFYYEHSITGISQKVLRAPPEDSHLKPLNQNDLMIMKKMYVAGEIPTPVIFAIITAAMGFQQTIGLCKFALKSGVRVEESIAAIFTSSQISGATAYALQSEEVLAYPVFEKLILLVCIHPSHIADLSMALYMAPQALMRKDSRGVHFLEKFFSSESIPKEQKKTAQEILKSNCSDYIEWDEKTSAGPTLLEFAEKSCE